jgi:membrane-bound inhibitor of C-type lysozyme
LYWQFPAVRVPDVNKRLRDMVRLKAKAAMCFLVAALAGCGTVDRVGEWWRGEGKEAPRMAPGTVEYLCEGKKTFQARFDTAPHRAWVKFPDREFRLDPVPGAVAGRYTNGRTTLNIKDDEAFLTEGTTVTYASCKRAATG